MIFDERMETFLGSFDHGNSDFMNEIEDMAHAEGVPVIRKDTQAFFRTILAVLRPSYILEVGCAVGFSALLMAENTPSSTRITTIEKDPERAEKARNNFNHTSMAERITLLEGDAADLVPSLKEEYDFIFMDAAKAQYILLLPQILNHLAVHGVLLTDNVLQEGVILESHYACVRRDRTIYKRMREYLYALTHNKILETSILPIGDGLTVSVKKDETS